MGKVIEFSRNPGFDDRIEKIFKQLHGFYTSNKDDIKKNEKMRNLFIEFFNAEQNYCLKKWKINGDQFLEKFDEVTYSDDPETKLVKELIYINLYHASKYIFPSLSVSDMSFLIRIRSKYIDLSEYKTKKLIDKIANPFDKEKLNLLSDEEKEKYLMDYINNIKENPKKEEKYEATFYDIEKYYINKAYDFLDYVGLDTEKFNDEKVLNTVLKIRRIEKYNNIDKRKFLEVARTIRYISLTDEQEFTGIANLINLFLVYKNKVRGLIVNDIFKILIIMKKNKIEDVDEAIKKYELEKWGSKMKTDDFDYYLPEELIAQTPIKERDHSRLLVLDKKNGEITHERFDHIINYLNKGDVLVINNTKVIPARIIGTKEETGAVIEVLMLKDLGKDEWECLCKPAKRVKEGTIIKFSDDLKVECTKVLDDGIRHFKFIYDGILLEILDRLGEMPLPPYIHEKLEDKNRYQTVYAKEEGSAAAPTAGLHFTKELLEKIKEKGIDIEEVTLHVGLGTFRPVQVEDVTKHKMHSEFYMMSKETAENLNKAKKEGRRIIAVGTTSTRTLETIMNLYGEFKACSGWTEIFIYPGFEFKGIDALITNFHLPKSTLVMLVSAFAGKEKIMNAYNEAVKNKYRFFSFGDSMFIK